MNATLCGICGGEIEEMEGIPTTVGHVHPACFAALEEADPGAMPQSLANLLAVLGAVALVGLTLVALGLLALAAFVIYLVVG